MASGLFYRHGRRVYLTADKRKACLAVGGEAIRRTRAAAIEADVPTLVDIVAQPSTKPAPRSPNGSRELLR